MKLKLLIVLASFAVTAGCADVNLTQQQALVEGIMSQLKECLAVNVPKRTAAQCALNFYNGVQTISNTDYAKPAALHLATSQYEVLLKYDRGQYEVSDVQLQMMKIGNTFDQEVAQAKQRTDAQNMEMAIYRQQMFIQAAQMLNPPRNSINCVSQNNGFVTTTNCN